MSLCCGIYARFSSEKQNDGSIQDQIRKGREFAAGQGWEVLDDHIYSDEATSGGTDQRRGLQRLLRAAESKPKPFDVLLVDDSSRLSRNLADSLKLHERLRFANVRLICISQGIDSESKQAPVIMAVHGISDQLYQEELRSKIRRGTEGKLLSGFHSGGRCFGYHTEAVEDPSQRGEYGRPKVLGAKLVVYEPEAGIVRRIFSLYAERKSLKGITCQLNAEGVTSPQPQKGRWQRSWCPSSIRTILRNERYRGVVTWGKSRKARNPQTGRRVRRPPEEPPTRVEMPGLRIVSQEIWNAVEERIQKNPRYPVASRAAYLFSGLLKCGVCGANFVVVSGSGKNHRYQHYGCPMRVHRHTCTNPVRLRRDRLERLLLAELQARVLQPDAIAYTLGQFEKELVRNLGEVDSGLEALRQRRAALEREIQNLTESLATAKEKEPAAVAAILRALAQREEKLAGIATSALNVRPGTAREKLRGVRKFVLSRLKDVRTLLAGDVARARLELGKHLAPIQVMPDGTAKVDWNWLAQFGGAGGQS